MSSRVRAFRRCSIVPFLFLALTAVACGSTSVTQMTGPEPVRCDVALSGSSASVPASASQVSVSLSTARDCTWSATSNASWIQVSPTAGQGDSPLTLNVLANTAQNTRSGSVTISELSYQVHQEAAAPPPPPPPPPPTCTYGLLPVSRTINENGGTRDVRIVTNAGCPWTAFSTASWITIIGPVSGTGNATIRYEVARNRSDDARIGAILIGGQAHVVWQSGD